MTAPVRSNDQRERDLEETAKLYLQGWKQSDIAAKQGVSQQQISNDLKEIRRRWRESTIRDFDQIKDEQLQKIDLMESEAWAAWIRSCGNRTVELEETTLSDKGDTVKSATKKEKLIGDPRFLQMIDTCILRRCKILGIDAEVKMAEINAAIAATIKAGFIVTAPNDQ
jgi:hypothetical protein